MSLVKDYAALAITVLGIIVAFALAITVGAIINGWVLSILWEWFIAPVFNLPSLSLPLAIGLALVISYLTYQNIDCKPKESDDGDAVIKLVMVMVLRPLLVLFFGWVIHLFI